MRIILRIISSMMLIISAGVQVCFASPVEGFDASEVIVIDKTWGIMSFVLLMCVAAIAVVNFVNSRKISKQAEDLDIDINSVIADVNNKIDKISDFLAVNDSRAANIRDIGNAIDQIDKKLFSPGFAPAVLIRNTAPMAAVSPYVTQPIPQVTQPMQQVMQPMPQAEPIMQQPLMQEPLPVEPEPPLTPQFVSPSTPQFVPSSAPQSIKELFSEDTHTKKPAPPEPIEPPVPYVPPVSPEPIAPFEPQAEEDTLKDAAKAYNNEWAEDKVPQLDDVPVMPSFSRMVDKYNYLQQNGVALDPREFVAVDVKNVLGSVVMKVAEGIPRIYVYRTGRNKCEMYPSLGIVDELKSFQFDEWFDIDRIGENQLCVLRPAVVEYDEDKKANILISRGKVTII